jgi:hypothetical protein
MTRTSSIAAACPNVKPASNSNCHGGSNYDQVDDLSLDKVSRDVYMYYLKALGSTPISLAMLLYVGYQVSV